MQFLFVDAKKLFKITFNSLTLNLELIIDFFKYKIKHVKNYLKLILDQNLIFFCEIKYTLNVCLGGGTVKINGGQSHGRPKGRQQHMVVSQNARWYPDFWSQNRFLRIPYRNTLLDE